MCWKSEDLDETALMERLYGMLGTDGLKLLYYYIFRVYVGPQDCGVKDGDDL